MAGQIQASFLPSDLPDLPGWQLGAALQPARETSGDFYDVISLPHQRLGIVMADVSGKGIPAAMIMNMAKTLLHIEAARDKAPDKVLKTVNNQLVESTKMDSFVTLIYVVIENGGRRAIITNAGHNPCLIYRSGSGQCEEIPSQNLPLAIVPDQVFDRREVDIAPGDCIVLYTDGVTDGMNNAGDFFGEEALKQVIIDSKDAAPEAVVSAILRSVEEFCEGKPPEDDRTVMVVERLQ